MSASEGLISFGFYCFGLVTGISIPHLHKKWLDYRERQKAKQSLDLPLAHPSSPVSPRPSTWVRNNGPATPYRELDSRSLGHPSWHQNELLPKPG